MTIRPVSLLVVDDDDALGRMLADAAAARGYRVECAPSLSAADAALTRATFDVALVDLTLGAESGFDVIRRIKEHTPDTEIVVMSASTSQLRDSVVRVIGVRIRSETVRHRPAVHDHRASGGAPPDEPGQSAPGMGTPDDQPDRGRHRPVAGISTMLAGALQCVVDAMGVLGGSIRLKDEGRGSFEEKAFAAAFAADHLGAGERRPSERHRACHARRARRRRFPRVDAGGTGRLDSRRQHVERADPAGEELLGTMSVAAARPGRFEPADQRLVAVIAGQIGVAVQNARLHDFVRRGKREWEQTFDAIGDPIAVFDSGGRLLRGNTALAAHLGRSITASSCQEVPSARRPETPARFPGARQ